MKKSKKYKIGINFDFIFVLCLVNLVLSFVVYPSYAVDCPSPVQQLSPAIQGQLKGEVEGLLSKLISGSLSGDVTVEYKNLFEKYPNADRIVMAQNMMSMTCQFINESTKLSDVQKLDQLHKLNQEIMRFAVPPKSEKPIIPRFSGSVGHYEDSLDFLNFLYDNRSSLVHIDIDLLAWEQYDLRYKKFQGGDAPYIDVITLYVRHLEPKNWRLWALEEMPSQAADINSNCERNYKHRARYYKLGGFYSNNPDLAGCTFEIYVGKRIEDFSGGLFNVRGYFTVDYVGYRRMDYSLIKLKPVSDVDALSLGRPR